VCWESPSKFNRKINLLLTTTAAEYYSSAV
jgi:hypothetical protein